MNRKPFKRSVRVAMEMRRVVSELVHRDISDPRLSSVTITTVKVSRDIREAKIFFAVHQKYQLMGAIEGFSSAKGYVRRELARRMNLRYTPDIYFFYDESFDYGTHIDDLLRSIEDLSC